jgi:hypothetical protein
MNKLVTDIKSLENVRDDWALFPKQFGDGVIKEYRCPLNGMDVLIIFSNLLWKNHNDPLIPSRINVSTHNTEIEQIFKQCLVQPTIKNWNKDLWVFRNNHKIGYQPFQYQIRFFPNEEALHRQIEKEEGEYKLISEFTVIDKKNGYYNEFIDLCYDFFSYIGQK